MTAAPRHSPMAAALHLLTQEIVAAEATARGYEGDVYAYRDEGYAEVATGFQALAATWRARALHLRLFVVDHAEVAS